MVSSCKNQQSTSSSHCHGNHAPSAMLTATDIARLLACSKKTVYRLADRGAIPRPLRLGQMMRWSRRAFEQWIADGCPKPKT